MTNLQIAVAVLLLLVAQASAQNSTNVTVQPPPPVDPTILYEITNSTQDGRLIMSPKLEVLNLDAVDPGTGIITTVKLTAYNSSVNGSKS